MDYRAMIQNRKSVREFKEKAIPQSVIDEIRQYYNTGCKRLCGDIRTELAVLDSGAKELLEGSAGYKKFMIGAPTYLLFLTADHPYAVENAGYMAEDVILKLTEMRLDSCWVTFTDGEQVKKSVSLNTDLKVAAIVAIGYGVRNYKQLRLNIRSMSNVDIAAKKQYFAPKKGIGDLVCVNTWGCEEGLDEQIGDSDNVLWQAFYAVSLAPSYLNRQPYGFVIHDGSVVLIRLNDPYTDELDGKLDLGIAMLHFGVVAEAWFGKSRWDLGAQPAGDLKLPEGCKVVAVFKL